MQNHKIKAIILDLGNVLVDFDHMIAARRLKEVSSVSEKQIYELFFDSSLTCLFEEGRISPQDFFLEVKKKIGLKIDYEQFVAIWNDIFFLTPKNYAVYNLAKGLRDRYILGLASNINILHFEYLKRKFGLFDIFHRIFLSYEIKARKPSLIIYQFILDELRLKPQEIFYTDDRKELVEAARKIGINAEVFNDADKFKEDLLKVGIELN